MQQAFHVEDFFRSFQKRQEKIVSDRKKSEGTISCNHYFFWIKPSVWRMKSFSPSNLICSSYVNLEILSAPFESKKKRYCTTSPSKCYQSSHEKIQNIETNPGTLSLQRHTYSPLSSSLICFSDRENFVSAD